MPVVGSNPGRLHSAQQLRPPTPKQIPWLCPGGVSWQTTAHTPAPCVSEGHQAGQPALGVSGRAACRSRVRYSTSCLALPCFWEEWAQGLSWRGAAQEVALAWDQPADAVWPGEHRLRRAAEKQAWAWEGGCMAQPFPELRRPEGRKADVPGVHAGGSSDLGHLTDSVTWHGLAAAEESRPVLCRGRGSNTHQDGSIGDPVCCRCLSVLSVCLFYFQY